MIKPINNFVLIKIDPPKTKIGHIHLPDSLVVKLNSGYVVDFSDKIKSELAVGDHVTFMEYRQSMWYDNQHILVPFESLNSRLAVGSTELKAVGSKILVEIDKQKQASNRFVGSLQLLAVDFNNNFAFNNQYGIARSIGCNVKEDITVGDIVIINQFVEGTDQTLIQKLDNGNELRVAETGTNFNYEIFGWIHDNEFFSTNHFVFVEEHIEKKEVVQNGSLLMLTENFFDTGNMGEGKERLTEFTVSHSNAQYKKGDKLLAKGKAAQIENLHISYIRSSLIEVQL